MPEDIRNEQPASAGEPAPEAALSAEAAGDIDPDAVTEVSEIEEGVETAACPSCSKPIPASSNFCNFCGVKLDARKREARTPSQAGYHLAFFDDEDKEILKAPLYEGVNTIGAESPAEGVFPDIDLNPIDEDIYVSRQHAEILVEGEKMMLRDVGSTNGTFLGEQKVGPESLPIGLDSELMFGNLVGEIVVEKAEAPGANAPATGNA